MPNFTSASALSSPRYPKRIDPLAEEESIGKETLARAATGREIFRLFPPERSFFGSISIFRASPTPGDL
jgi:hypothetical protein